MTDWLQYIPLLLFLGYYLLTAAMPALRLRRSHQINVHRLDHWRTVHGFLTRLERWVLRLVGLVVVLRAFAPTFNTWLLPLTRLQMPLLFILGCLLVVLGTTIIALAQRQMGEAWRIDIDAQAKGELATNGLFRFSRNPIYVGTLFVLGGFFLVIPNAVTLFAFALEWLLLHYEIRQEERYLKQRYGDAYRSYCQQTARWL